MVLLSVCSLFCFHSDLMSISEYSPDMRMRDMDVSFHGNDFEL